MEIEQIYNMYFKDVFRYVYSMTKNESLSEDITQETFLKVLKSIKKYRIHNQKLEGTIWSGVSSETK